MIKYHQNSLLKIFILWFPISFLTIRHGVHIALYGILLIFLYELFKQKFRWQINKDAILIFLSLSGIFLANLLQQSSAQDFNLKAFDGPSRLLIAGLIVFYLSSKNINYLEIIETAIPIGLVVLLLYLQLQPNYFWGNRWANNFVDPNSLGSQATILSMICLLTIGDSKKFYLYAIKAVGAFCGFYIAIKTESRGGWITIPFMATCYLVIQYKRAHSESNKHQLMTAVGLSLFIAIGVSILISFNESVQHRISHTLHEIITWFKDPLIYTSAGSRMSMWVSSIQLICENWFGYGEIKIKQIVANHPLYTGIHQHGIKDLIQAGPHSDILSKGLSLGIFGVISYLTMIVTPFVFFLKKNSEINKDIQRSATVGLIYITGVFVAGLFNESLSLKYLCTFYGLMIACLTAQVLRDNSKDPNPTP